MTVNLISGKHPEFIAPLPPCNEPVRRCRVPAEQATHRIALMRYGAHGDIIMASPLLRALREAYPDAHLTWIVERSARESVDASPYIDSVLLWDSMYWKKMVRRALYPLWLARVLSFGAQVRRRCFDVFISLQPEDWPLLARGIGAPVRIGVFDTFREYHRRDRTSRRTRLYTHAFTHADLPPHRTDQYLLPLQALGIDTPRDKRTVIGYTEEDRASADRFLASAGHEEDERLVVIAPTTNWPSRCWPGERFAELGDRLAEERPCRVLLIGTARDRAALDTVAKRMRTRPVVAAGTLTFRQMAALIGRAGLVVSGDTGPMHVAAAVGTPFLALFGPTPTEGRVPLTGGGIALAHPVPCGPCEQERCPRTDEPLLCLRLITVEEALAAASRLLADKSAAYRRLAVV